MKKEFGYLRETSAKAKKDGLDPETGLCRTGLDEYLSIIFPDVNDWIHDKIIENSNSKRRPDYRSETLKLIVEFDGLNHYTNPLVILNDKSSTLFYENLGYKVVRIPYFIQLTTTAIKILFGVEMNTSLFDGKIPSLSVKSKNTPAFLCKAGVERMIEEFKKFPEQYEVNKNYLKKINNPFLTGIDMLN